MMKKFDFLLGDWNLEYIVPKSAFSEAASGKGSGSFRKTLGDNYILFDYQASLTTGNTMAHGIFTWDEKLQLYRYWWFEDSGNFMHATCNFTDEETLHLNWHESLLIQTFKQAGPNRMILKMEHPGPYGKYDPILEVIFTRNYGGSAL